ncbi:PQ loop repeat-domain-containing protein [Syncephalis fuscata]|nr:PQ loop repeat-domain-containing protein [Syncephalis fuscata]
MDFTKPEHVCEPYSPFFAWLNDWMNICVEDPRIATSNLFGYLSIFSWLTAQVPQLYTNYLNQSAASLSLRFLFNWLMGDITNFIGSVLTRQLPFQIFLALYFCLIDMALLCQYFYYRRKDRRRRRHFTTPSRISRRASHSAAMSHDQHGHHRQRRRYCLTGSVDSHGAWFAPQHEVEQAVRQNTEEHLHHAYGADPTILSADEECIESVHSVHSHRLPPLSSESESENDAKSTENTPLLEDASLVPYYTTSRRNSMAIRQSVSTLFAVSFLAFYQFIDPFSNGLDTSANGDGGVVFHSTSTSWSHLTRRAFIAQATESDFFMDRWFTRDNIGIIISWTCTVLYLTSRIPQIYKNYKRQSAEGLSVFMFMFAAIGNFTYVASIFARSTSVENIKHALPFLIGSGGTLIFDMTIFMQFYYYTQKEVDADYDFLPSDAPVIVRSNAVSQHHANNDDQMDGEVDTVRDMSL